MSQPYRHGRCKLHGGATPTHRKAARRREAERAVELYGLPREVEPHERCWKRCGGRQERAPRPEPGRSFCPAH